MAIDFKNKKLWLKFGIGFVFILLIVFFYLTYSKSLGSQKWFDKFYACQPQEVNSDIVVVEIDDDSLKEIGLWPWSRLAIAELLKQIERFSPEKIGVDINLVEESSANDDLALQEVLLNNDNIYIPIEAQDLSYNKDLDKWQSSAFLRPYYLLNRERLGHINFINSTDNIVRHIPDKIIDKRNDQGYKAFSSLIAGKDWNKSYNQLYFCPSEYFMSVSAEDLLNIDEETDLEEYQKLLNGKKVLIGLTSPDLHDYVYTPISQGHYMFGVYLHANAVNTLLNNKSFVALNQNLELGILLIFLLLWLVYLLFTEKYTVTNLIIVFFLVGMVMFVNMLFFDKGILFNGWYFLLGIFILYLYVLMIHYILLYLSKQNLRKLFGFYLSEAILEELLENPELVKLGGIKREMTVLFSDLRGFTSLSEGLSPEELVSVLNKYLSEMTAKIFDYNGVVDKYIGDAIMAFWGAPLDDDKQVENACFTALLMRDYLKILNKKKVWIKDEIELKLGIGINTGEMIVGNMGGEQRFDYTVMGDSVNLGARLEGLNKIYGTEIIVSEFTYEKVKNDFVFRFLDKVAVKGKDKAVKIYELIARKENCSESKKAEIEKFNQVVKLYLQQDFKKALKLLQELDGEEKIFNIYTERLEEFLKNPPHEKWDGVFVLKTK